MSKDEISEALQFDGLLAAEKLTGRSYKEDDATSWLGMGLMMQNNDHKERLLRENRDSFFRMTFAELLALYADLGFEEVYREWFTGSGGEETYVILWHPDGLLAHAESYNGTSMNSTKVLYNYQHKDVYFGWPLKSSGSYEGDVWIGDHDAREGIRHSLDAMRDEGEFLPVWIKRPWLSLCNYAESKSVYGDWREDMERRNAITELKISLLPEHVRAAITP